VKRISVRIVPMTRSHIKACDAIVSASEPWNALGEQMDFAAALSRKDRPYDRAYVCTVENKTAGFIIFTPQPVFARGGYIRSIGVAPSMRRLGIGGKLLSFAEKIISGLSPNSYLCVSSFNRKAQAFYKNAGYTMAGKLQDLILPGASEYIYWKRLMPRTPVRKNAKNKVPLNPVRPRRIRLTG
jgi:ribosomal protein S18 acetylase RimI-like enzyme